jgi:hypothetical protein
MSFSVRASDAVSVGEVASPAITKRHVRNHGVFPHFFAVNECLEVESPDVFAWSKPTNLSCAHLFARNSVVATL